MTTQFLKGRNALVTGASKGLGRCMALALAGAGADVALVARDLAPLNGTAEAVRKLGVKATVWQADVSDEAQVQRLEKAAASELGRLHILINNAGMNIRKPLNEFSLAEWRQVLDTNLTSVFLMCRSFVPMIKGHGYGRIINMTSMLSHVALGGRTAYCASKAGVLGFTRALALELAAENITVNGISPGPFATEINTPILDDPEMNRGFLAKIPVGRWGKPEDIGPLALYVCSEVAGFMTGTDIVIDGGWTAQ